MWPETQREKDALDNYITGHYGEDQNRGEDDETNCPACGAEMKPIPNDPNGVWRCTKCGHTE